MQLNKYLKMWVIRSVLTIFLSKYTFWFKNCFCHCCYRSFSLDFGVVYSLVFILKQLSSDVHVHICDSDCCLIMNGILVFFSCFCSVLPMCLPHMVFTILVYFSGLPAHPPYKLCCFCVLKVLFWWCLLCHSIMYLWYWMRF